MFKCRGQDLSFSKPPRFRSLGRVYSLEDVVSLEDEDEGCPEGQRHSWRFLRAPLPALS